jgi:hypothetical protein
MEILLRLKQKVQSGTCAPKNKTTFLPHLFESGAVAQHDAITQCSSSVQKNQGKK